MSREEYGPLNRLKDINMNTKDRLENIIESTWDHDASVNSQESIIIKYVIESDLMTLKKEFASLIGRRTIEMAFESAGILSEFDLVNVSDRDIKKLKKLGLI